MACQGMASLGMACFDVYLDNYSQIIAPNLYIQFIFQFVILLPIYMLHFCDGASSCIPAIILQHFKEDCSIVRINLSLGEESFIGMYIVYARVI